MKKRVFLELSAFKLIYSLSIKEETQTFKFVYFFYQFQSFTKGHLKFTKQIKPNLTRPNLSKHNIKNNTA